MTTCGFTAKIAASQPCPDSDALPFSVPLDRIALPPNLPAGLSPWVLFAIAHERRNGGHQVRDPILVRRHPDWPGAWLIVDGRHRYIASVMAGCSDILCVEQI